MNIKYNTDITYNITEKEEITNTQLTYTPKEAYQEVEFAEVDGNPCF